MAQILPIVVVLLPFFGSILIVAIGSKKKNLRDLINTFASVLTFIFNALIVKELTSGNKLDLKLLRLAKNVDLYFMCDPFGAVFASLSSFLWIFVSIYSIGYMRALKEHNETRFYFAFAVAIGSAQGVAYSGNLLTMYMFYEMLTFATYPLVSHHETEEAIRAGRKYLAYLLTGATFVLFGVVMTHILHGKTDFVPGGFFSPTVNSILFVLIFLCFFLGFGTKAAIMPLHEWLPSAMVAPAPVSALLHAVAVVKAGVFCVVRTILFIFGPDMLKMEGLWMLSALIVTFTIILANILAIYEDNLKRRLAFSTVNNLSIIILGALIFTPTSIKGAILHMVYHGFMKITLFMCAGAIYVGTKREMVNELDGIGKIMPSTMISFTICALGLIGIPPVCGFLSKWYLCLGAIEKKSIIFLVVFLLSALLDAIYFAPIIFKGFFKNSKGRSKKARLPFTVVFPLVFTALASIFLFLFPNSFFRFYELASMVSKLAKGG